MSSSDQQTYIRKGYPDAFHVIDVKCTKRLLEQTIGNTIEIEMRRTSLTPIQARSLGQLLRGRREQRGLGVRGLAAASGVNVSSIVSLERGDILAPQPDTLKALAAALDVPVTDLFTVAGWLPPSELPTLKPYLRAKYRQLDEGAIADLERYAQQLAKKHGSTGPIDHEDEGL